MAKWDIAPRFGVAYALNTKTSIRAGFGENYDNFGMSIANQVATLGSAGLLGSESDAGRLGVHRGCSSLHRPPRHSAGRVGT